MESIKMIFLSYKKACIVFCLIISCQGIAQEDLQKKFKERMQKLVNTEWVADNPTYVDTVRYAPKKFRYVFTKGIHGEHMKIAIFADLNTVGEQKLWDGYYLWNPKSNQIMYHSISFAGQVANGSVVYQDAKSTNTFVVHNYDGTLEDHKDETILNGETMVSKTYTKDTNGNWNLLQELEWKQKVD